MDRQASIRALCAAGFDYTDAVALRRASMTLHRWYELECGTGHGCIERDVATGKAYWLNSYSMRRTRIADRETGANRRIDAIMARYPDWIAYRQTDPRGCALYVVNRADLGDRDIESCYTRGVAVHQ